MAIKVGICGGGVFADCLIPPFKAHPEVSRVVLCDVDLPKLRKKAACAVLETRLESWKGDKWSV